MATSTFKGYVRHSATYTGENSPFWAGSARNHLVNNANHIADEAAQVLVNWTASTSTSYLTPTLSGGALAATGTYYRITRFGPFPLLRKADGTSYTLRGRMRWYLAAAGTGTALVVVSAPARAIGDRDFGSATNVLKFTTTVTTDAWDDADTDNICNLTAEDMDYAQTEQTTLLAVAGAAVSVFVPLVTVTIYAKATATTAIPRLTGLYLAEYIGT